MLIQALAALLSVIGLALVGWGLIEGPAWFIIVGIVLMPASGLLYNVGRAGIALSQIRKRRRLWGQLLSVEEKRHYGSRLVFEPTCLKSGCGGPVLELINNTLPASPGPFVARFDPNFPDYHVQGAGQCARCTQRYTYTIVHGGLHLRASDDDRLSRSFPPL
jgi:hypothetical protein